jgi:molecular chaperone DnaK
VEIHLLQGEGELVSENRHIGRFTFDGIAPQPIGIPRIQSTFSISEGGKLEVEAENLDTGRIERYGDLWVEVVKR